MRAGGIISPWGDCSDVFVQSGPTVNDGQWHSVAITYTGSGGIISLYIDSVLVIQTSSFTDACGYALTPIQFNTKGEGNMLGAEGNNNTPFNGDLRNIEFYDYSLSSSAAMADLVSE